MKHGLSHHDTVGDFCKSGGRVCWVEPSERRVGARPGGGAERGCCGAAEQGPGPRSAVLYHACFFSDSSNVRRERDRWQVGVGQSPSGKRQGTGNE